MAAPKIHISLLVMVLVAGLSQPVQGEPEPIRPDPALASDLKAAMTARGPDYHPRTRHLDANGAPRFINRLIREDSPYLLQHAHNPVDWYPWGTEAFEVARAQNKPIFLSIGYATCHWCHVMERESFEDEAIARFLNQHFIAIKVDRERRPDVDATYMTGLMLTAGQGGWPLSSVLTPSGKPFFAGTYYPPDTFLEILKQLSEAWRDQQPELVQRAEQLSTAIARSMTDRQTALIASDGLLSRAIDQLIQHFDRDAGGFGMAPKFPNESNLLVLVRRVQQDGDSRALEMLRQSLDAMARGGIHDQVGGGFHRYATDRHWLIPHFEKMLYTQAQLARVYLAAHELTGEHEFRRIAEGILDYVLADMRSSGGVFYSATDADSEGIEGGYFVWTPDQIKVLLEPAQADLARLVFGISEAGNFEGATVLHRPISMEELAARRDQSVVALWAEVDAIRSKMSEARRGRTAPLRDDKIVTGWNGLMIAALAEAGRVLGRDDYLEAARGAATRLLNAHRNGASRLYRSSLDGRVSGDAGLQDYTFLGEALLALYDVRGNAFWLDKARNLTAQLLLHYLDPDSGVFYMNRRQAESLLFVRPQQSHDAATPSGNASAAQLLIGLWHRTGEQRYQDAASRLVGALAGNAGLHPGPHAYLILGADTLAHGQSGSLQYAARGVIRATARLNRSESRRWVVAELDIAPGWHLNSDQPSDPALIGTRLSAPGLSTVRYPPPIQKAVSFVDEPLSLFEGTVEIVGEMSVPGAPGIKYLELTLQACNDRICLPPETLRLNVPRYPE